jgi:hypothetical protein
MEKRRKAFVLMPFDSDLKPVFDDLICPPLEEAGFHPKRADSEPDMRNVVDALMKDIGTADLIVADLTRNNANVFYELGVAHSIRKLPVIHITQDDGKKPFDVASYRYVKYSRDFSKVAEFKRQLKHYADLAAKGELEYSNPVEDSLPEELRTRKPGGLVLYVTRLMFPQVVNTRGPDGLFPVDSNISIVNRSGALGLGPASARSGCAILSFYPWDGGAPVQMVTRAILPGRAEHFTQSSTSFSSQLGHVIAECFFPASGYCTVFEKTPGSEMKILFAYTAERIYEGRREQETSWPKSDLP